MKLLRGKREEPGNEASLIDRAGQRSYVKLLRGRREEPGNEASLQVQSMIHMRIPNRPLLHTYILSWTVIAPCEHACVHAQSGIRPLMYVPVHNTYIQTKYQNINLEVQQEHFSAY